MDYGQLTIALLSGQPVRAFGDGVREERRLLAARLCCLRERQLRVGPKRYRQRAMRPTSGRSRRAESARWTGEVRRWRIPPAA